MDSFHLADRPCVAAAIEAAAACNTLAELDAAIRDYDALALARTQPHTPLHATSVTNPLMIVAEKPEPQDLETGQPFSGPAGGIMREVLASAGLDLANICVVYALPWTPPMEKAPNATELSSGRPFLFRAVEIVRPRAILMPGRHVYDALFMRREPITPLLGLTFGFKHAGLSIPARLVYHPAFPLRFKTEIPDYAKQIRDFADDYEEPPLAKAA